MSLGLTKSVLVSAAFIAFSLLGARSALAVDPDDNIARARRDCNAPQPNCSHLDGNALTNCELRVGQIIHACNKVQDWEANVNGGPGTQWRKAGQKRDNAALKGEAD
jgi:hypothetical protein